VYPLSLHDALPIFAHARRALLLRSERLLEEVVVVEILVGGASSGLGMPGLHEVVVLRCPRLVPVACGLLLSRLHHRVVPLRVCFTRRHARLRRRRGWMTGLLVRDPFLQRRGL